HATLPAAAVRAVSATMSNPSVRRGLVVSSPRRREGGDEHAPRPLMHRTHRDLPAPSPRKACCWRQPGRFSGSGIILALSLPTPRGSGCDRVRPPLQLRGSGGFAPPSLTRLRRVRD